MESKLYQNIEVVDDYLVSFFKLEELKNKKSLQVVYFSLVMSLWVFVYSFYRFLNSKIFNTTCWPFFDWCSNLQEIVLLNSNLELRSLLYTFLLLLFTFSFLSFYKKKFGISLLLSSSVFFLSIFPIFIFTNSYNALIHHQEHYLFYAFLIFLFARHSRIQVLAVFYFLTYFLSTFPKYTSEFWTLGLVISPFIPSYLTPIASNIVILSQLILPFFLLFGKKKYRIFALIFFEIFHLYSVNIATVNYIFFWIILPIIYVLYYDGYEKPETKIFRKNSLVVVIIAIFIFLSLYRLVIPGNDALTKEGSSYSMNMFSAFYKQDIEYQDKNMQISKFFPTQDRYGIYFYDFYGLLSYIQKQNCIDEKPRSLKVNLYTTYNSYEMVNEVNYCNLQYNPWRHNEWIGKNIVYNEDLNKLNKMQLFFYNIKEELVFFYTTLFIFMSALTISKFFKEKE